LTPERSVPQGRHRHENPDAAGFTALGRRGLDDVSFVCDQLAAPVLIGILRPVILLPPAALNGWTIEQLEMVLWHELAHLRRWDNLINLIQRIVESLLCFHPAVWWISAWARLEREYCCDLIVVQRPGRPRAYVETVAVLAGAPAPCRSN
jgi:beta-lactamase regulating signal transducer with metallopeptidase domain